MAQDAADENRHDIAHQHEAGEKPRRERAALILPKGVVGAGAGAVRLRLPMRSGLIFLFCSLHQHGHAAARFTWASMAGCRLYFDGPILTKPLEFTLRRVARSRDVMAKGG